MDRQRKKNLIMIHIESLSNVLYHHNRSIFQNIEKIIDKCIVYENFYSTSTSTLMVLADLLYGDTKKFEASKSLNELQSNNYAQNSLFQLLTNHGYKTHCIFYPKWSLMDDSSLSNIMGQVTYKNSFQGFNKEIDLCIKDNAPFALYIYNGTSGISFLPLSGEKIWRTSWKEGYSNSDGTIGYIFGLMEKYRLMENTVVILFGDHGDDFWSHAFNNGFCHSIEPYANMVHTPLFVYNATIGKQNLEDIISIVDIRDLILHMLDLEAEVGLNSKIYGGFRSNRKYAFSRNLFAGQSNLKTMLSKCYSITDGNYNLLVRQEGLEFYLECFDVTNHCNLLKFYCMDNNGRLFLKNKYKINTNRHFTKVMTKKHVSEIENDFYRMNKELIYQVIKTYSSVHLKEGIWKDELNFNRVYNQEIEDVVE